MLSDRPMGVDPEADLAGGRHVVDRRHRDRQRAAVSAERVGQFSDEGGPGRGGGRPGRRIVGEGELLVVDIDPVGPDLACEGDNSLDVTRPP